MKKTTLNFRFAILYCMLFLTSTISNHLYAQCTKGATTTIFSNKNYSNFNFPGDVIITNKAIVNLTGTIKMKKDAKIVVNNDCILNVNNATITSFCANEMWQGIEAYGSNWFMNLNLSNGWVNIDNSTIEKAKIACLNTENSASYQSKRGGWFKFTNSKFINNWIVLRADYQSPTSTGIIRIENCTFEVNNPAFAIPILNLKSLGFAFDFLNPFRYAFVDVRNTIIDMTNCTFEVKGSGYSPSSGIPALNGINSTNSYSNINKTRFNNISGGILHESIGQGLARSTLNNIQYCTFNNVMRNLYIKNTNWMTVGNNLFTTNGNAGNFIRIENSPAPYVFNNSMSSTFTGLHSDLNYLYFNNCGSMNANIQYNYFSSSHNRASTAVYALGNNGDNSNSPMLAQGINLTCNDFRGGTFNSAGKSINLLTGSTLRKYQGRLLGNNIVASGNLIREILNDGSNTLSYYYNGSPNTGNNQFPIVNGPVRNVSAPSSQCSPATGVNGGGSWVIASMANPGGSKVLTSAELKEAVDTREILNKELIKLKNEANTFLMVPENYEKLDEIYANASAVKAEKDNYTKLLVSNQMSKKYTDQSHSNEEIISLLYSFENTMGDIMVADYYFFENNPQQAQTILENIKTKYTLNSNQTREINDIKEYYTLLYPFVFLEREWDALNEQEIATLKRMAGEESGMAKGRACSWLELNKIKYCPDPIQPENVEYNTAEGTHTDLYPMVALYPNPAITYIDINIQTPIEYSQATLKIYTTMGELKYNQSHQNCDFFRIDVANWNRGYYHYTLESNGVELKSGTISLIEQ